VADVSTEHRGSSTKQLDTTIANEQAMASTETTSKRDAGSEEDNVSDDTSDSGNAFYNGGRVKIGVDTALAGMSYELISLHSEGVCPSTRRRVRSCGGHPNAEVFAHQYELHYHNKKIHLEEFETTFAAQFGRIPFHPSWFGNCARFTPAMWNKWTSGWDSNWFYCKVPSEQRSDFRGQRTYPLSSEMTPLVYEMDVSSSCGPEDADFASFIKVTSLIGGRDAVE
jgi:hypothetical protein